MPKHTALPVPPSQTNQPRPSYSSTPLFRQGVYCLHGTHTLTDTTRFSVLCVPDFRNSRLAEHTEILAAHRVREIAACVYLVNVRVRRSSASGHGGIAIATARQPFPAPVPPQSVPAATSAESSDLVDCTSSAGVACLDPVLSHTHSPTSLRASTQDNITAVRRYVLSTSHARTH